MMRLLDLRVSDQSTLSSAVPVVIDIFSGIAEFDFPIFPTAMRIQIVRRTGAPQGEHAFLGHPWWQNGSDQGIA